MSAEQHLLRAAAAGDVEQVQRLLALGAPVDAVAASGWSALSYAAASGHTGVMQALLDAGASHTLENVQLQPIHVAAGMGELEAVCLLLQSAPATAAATAAGGVSPLMAACAQDNPEMFSLLLAVAPETSGLSSADSSLPIHAAATCSRDGATVRMLLAAVGSGAAAMAAARGPHGMQPIHYAALCGRTAAAKVLLQAAPDSACQLDSQGCLPLSHALDRAAHIIQGGPPQAGASNCLTDYTSIVMSLIDSMPPEHSLGTIAPTHMKLSGTPAEHLCLPLFPRIASRHALSTSQWQRVPSPCPGLAAALPAVLARSPAEAALLVAHLPPADQLRLRTFALCLSRTQRQLGLHLPGLLVGRILSLFDA